MEKNITFITLALVAALGVIGSCAKLKGTKNVICDQLYALCTSAQCVPSPDNSNEAICYCEVRKGKSLGLTDCDKRAPTTDQQGIQHLISTFSFDDFPVKEVMSCASGMPWSDCLDQPCTIDPMDPSQAICLCPVRRTGDFKTLGGNCEQSTCETGYWSAASSESFLMNVQVLMKALGLENPPQSYCPE
ncbi:MAG: hypothetical protein WAM28_05200 [Chlamydiales bacterium]